VFVSAGQGGRDNQEQTLLHFLPAVDTLSRVSTLHIHCPQGGPGARPSAPPPEGCIVGTVDHSCQLHLNVQVMTVYWKRPEQGSNNTGGDMFSL
jgi:hypothetical protein